MKKTIIISLLVVAMVASMAIVFAGCDFDGEDEFTIGAVYITSQNEDTGYTYAHHSGIKKAMETLGLKDSQLIIEDNIPDTDMDATRTAIDNLVGKGCDMIIGISYGYMDAMEEAAEKYPDVIFTHATGYKSNDTNFNNYFGRIYQARYLAGIAAGLDVATLTQTSGGYFMAGIELGLTYRFAEDWSFFWKAIGGITLQPHPNEKLLDSLTYIIQPAYIGFAYHI